YKTTKDFLLRFGLKDLHELPSVEEFEKLVASDEQGELFASREAAIPDATGVPEVPENGGVEETEKQNSQQSVASGDESGVSTQAQSKDMTYRSFATEVIPLTRLPRECHTDVP